MHNAQLRCTASFHPIGTRKCRFMIHPLVTPARHHVLSITVCKPRLKQDIKINIRYFWWTVALQDIIAHVASSMKTHSVKNARRFTESKCDTLIRHTFQLRQREKKGFCQLKIARWVKIVLVLLL